MPVLMLTDNVEVMAISGLTLGALLPDIDEPRSFVGKRIPFLPHVINKIFGHRGMTHSLIAILLMFGIYLLCSNIFTLMLVLGYFLHVLEDTFSVSGIAWLLPFSDRKLAFKLYKTGGISENLIFIIMLVVLTCTIYFVM